jgi:archaellum biogenesis ATPase FlaH
VSILSQQVTIDDRLRDGFKGLPEHFLVMVASSPTKYAPTITSVLRQLVTPDTIGVYISANKPYFSLIEEMKDLNIPTSNMYFLDCASGLMGKQPQEVGNTFILSGPSNLTELSMTLSDLLSEKLKGRENKTILFLDSVSTFLIYNDANMVAKFLHAISGKVRAHNISGVFFSLDEDVMKGALASTVQFQDRVLEIN